MVKASSREPMDPMRYEEGGRLRRIAEQRRIVGPCGRRGGEETARLPVTGAGISVGRHRKPPPPFRGCAPPPSSPPFGSRTRLDAGSRTDQINPTITSSRLSEEEAHQLALKPPFRVSMGRARPPNAIRAALFDLYGVPDPHRHVLPRRGRRLLTTSSGSVDATAKPSSPSTCMPTTTPTSNWKPRADGVRSFLAARHIALPEGSATTPDCGHRGRPRQPQERARPGQAVRRGRAVPGPGSTSRPCLDAGLPRAVCRLAPTPMPSSI